MLESKNVVKQYGGKAAVNDLSMVIEPGHIYGFLGPNGSGKSTWMKMAAGLIVPDRGQILLSGIPVGVETKKYIAYMPTEPFYYSYMRIKDVRRYYKDFFEDFDVAQFDLLMRRMELDERMKVRALSSGMMAKLKIAATLSRHALVYLLDEPLNGIDLLAREEIIRMILECMNDNAALVISSHLVEELEKIIDSVIFIKNGQLALTGDVEGIRQQRGESIVELYKDIYR